MSLGALAIVASYVVGSLTVLGSKQRSVASSAPDPPARASPIPTPLATGEAPAETAEVTRTVATIDLPSADASESATPATPSTARAKPSTPVASAAPLPAPAKQRCVPPYEVDATGTKRWKLKCLK